MPGKKLKISQVPVAKTAMLIRRSVTETFNAFIDPEITSRFWFSKGSGKLELGKQVTWEWEMYGITVNVNVKEIVTNERIVIEWGTTGEPPSKVEWRFIPHGENAAFVSVINSGFSGDGDELVTQALDSTGGFALVLAGLKAFLEHGLSLNLIADRFPRGLESH